MAALRHGFKRDLLHVSQRFLFLFPQTPFVSVLSGVCARTATVVRHVCFSRDFAGKGVKIPMFVVLCRVECKEHAIAIGINSRHIVCLDEVSLVH